MQDGKEVRILRDLAKAYMDVARKDIQDERRELWRKQNSLERTRPLVLVMPAGRAWSETREVDCVCEDPFYRGFERNFRRRIYMDFIGDDTVLEPWVTVGAHRWTPPEGPWGFTYDRFRSDDPDGAYLINPPLKRLEDIEKLPEIHHIIDEEATAQTTSRLKDAIGDLIEIGVDRAPAWRHWRGDISTDLGQLRGVEQMMWDMTQNREWLHRLVGAMSEGIQRVHREAEEAGDWRLNAHSNQAMPYSRELGDPRADGEPVTRDKLWYFAAAQEMAQVSPAMHEEFILNYQLPVLEKFGLVAYGCCEDYTHKIDMLRKVPNLRRIAVTPVADVAKCAEQIGADYVFSWRPNPSQMICCGWDPDLIRRVVRDAMEASKGCHVDITLKDIESVQGHPENLREWVKLVRSITDDYA